MPKAYSYIRFSKTEQIKGDSLRRQTHLSERYASDHGLILDNSLNLKDLGLSGYSGKHRSDRGALGQFLKLIEMDKIEKGSILLVESLDRLSREEITEAMEQFLAIIRKGIKIVTLLDAREYTKETVNANAAELIVSLTIMSRAHEESVTKSRRLSSAWENKRKQADVKILTAKAPAWLKLSEDKTKFEHIRDRVKMIRHIYKLKLSGIGKTAIVRQLNRMEGWQPVSKDKRKQEEGWRESYVNKILKSRAVIGEYQPHQMIKGKRQPVGDPIIDYFPSVVDKEIFYRVQEQFSKNKHRGGQIGKISNLFSHIVKCGYCGGSMAFVDKGPAPKGGQYLVCDRARRGLDCCRTSIKYRELENLALTYCKELRPQDILSDNNEIAIGLLKDQLEGITGELNSINKEIENISDSISSTPDKRVREILDKQMTKRLDKQAALNKEKVCLQKQIDTESRSFETVDLTLDSIKELFDFLDKANGKKLINVRLKLRSELRRLINKVEIYPEGRFRFTIESAQNALEEMSKLVPEGTEGYTWIKERLSRQVNYPKKFRYFIIHFLSGSMRHIVPEHKLQLAIDIDRDKKVMSLWRTGLDGETICEEFSDRGLKIKVKKKN